MRSASSTRSTAEDIGKFPDTNLSESLQRITGISIDRRNGEGALVTARGFGPQFNMVTLNGRQMPSADAFGGGERVTGGFGGNTRSFNFANLAAEAISAVEVYKTGRADVATGGIGASINMRTARPLDNDGLVLNIGAKAVNDTTNRVGDDITPEVSGIFSYATDNKMFGIGLSASYQKRDSGSSTSTVNDWHIQPWNAIPAAATTRPTWRSRRCTSTTTARRTNTADDVIARDDRECSGEWPALRHPERHSLRVLGFGA